MTATFDDYNAAIHAFWTGRDLQTQKQVDSGKIDAGTRGSVTGGQHMTPLQDVIADQFAPLVDMGAVVRRTGLISLPGFYRRAKNWDIVVTYEGTLVAAIECKSQVGSFGNNFNNRAEEAIGNGVDLWRAYEAGFVDSVRPWLGFVFVIEHAPGSTSIVTDRGEPVYPTDPAFDRSSYTDRWSGRLHPWSRLTLFVHTAGQTSCNCSPHWRQSRPLRCRERPRGTPIHES